MPKLASSTGTDVGRSVEDRSYIKIMVFRLLKLCATQNLEYSRLYLSSARITGVTSSLTSFGNES